MRCWATVMLFIFCHSAVALPSKSYPYQGCFEIAAQMHQVPLELLLAVAATESNWQADARSHANAHGIMQIQWPGTARHLGVKHVAELYNPCLNIALGAQYLRELVTQFAELERALAAYNYGPTRIKASAQIPPGAQAYAAKVLSHQERIVAGLLPKRLAPATERKLVTFASHHRAQSVARLLDDKLQGATVRVEKVKKPQRGSAVVLDVGSAGLTVQDHVTLKNLGWSL